MSELTPERINELDFFETVDLLTWERPTNIPQSECQCGCGQHVASNRSYVIGHSHRRARYVSRPDANGCCVWLGAGDGSGYGRLRVRGRDLCAHRFIYEQRAGAIPKGMQIDHLCRNRRCVNPEHLEPVTLAENIRRGSLTKITMDTAIEVHRWIERGHKQRDIAAQFGLSEDHVSKIKRGIVWRGVGLDG